MKSGEPDDEFFGTIPAKGPPPGPTVGDAARIAAAVVALLGLLVLLGLPSFLFLALLAGIGYAAWARCRSRPHRGLRVFAIAGLGGLLLLAVLKFSMVDDRRIGLAILDLLLVYPILLGSGGAWLSAAWSRSIEARSTWAEWLVLGVLVVLGSIVAVLVLGWIVLGLMFSGFYA